MLPLDGCLEKIYFAFLFLHFKSMKTKLNRKYSEEGGVNAGICVFQWRRHSCPHCFMQRVQVSVWCDSYGCNFLVHLPALIEQGEEWHCPMASPSPVQVGSSAHLLYQHCVGCGCWAILTSTTHRDWACWHHWSQATVHLLPVKLQEVDGSTSSEMCFNRTFNNVFRKKKKRCRGESKWSLIKTWWFDVCLSILHIYKCTRKLATWLNPIHVYTCCLVLAFYLVSSNIQLKSFRNVTIQHLPYLEWFLSLYVCLFVCFF